MEKLLNYEDWSSVVVSTLTGLAEKTVGYIPNIIGALVILLIGWLISRLVQSGLSRTFEAIGINKLAVKAHIDQALKESNIERTVSEILARIIFWILFLVFLVSAFETLGLDVISDSLDKLVAYIPNVIAGILILLLGSLIANFARDVVKTAATSASITYSKMLGQITYFFLMLFMVIIALGQLGINTSLFTANITIIIAGFVGIAVLAVGLGGRSAISNMIGAHYASDLFKKGDDVVIGDIKGKVKSITNVAIILDTKDGEIVVPASEVMNSKTVR